ncbi:hypothetical protein [Sphingopyxis sp.]|uniref:hypothetical protein n=1 Tax=Sphingopyxis sp. TaxID=1908224 RepID=UPI003FA6D2EE
MEENAAIKRQRRHLVARLDVTQINLALQGYGRWPSSSGRILVSGGTSLGKATLANALLAGMSHLDERVILIEGTRELQYAAPEVVALRTRSGTRRWPAASP